MKNGTEYQVMPRKSWVQSLEEEEKESPSTETQERSPIVLDGYYIVSDKKIALMPADLTSTEITH